MFLVLNFILWGGQEIYYYNDTKEIKKIEQSLDVQKFEITYLKKTVKVQEGEVEYLSEKMDFWNKNDMVEMYNSNVDKYNLYLTEYKYDLNNYNELIDEYNNEIEKLNELIKKSGSRWYIIPLPIGNKSTRSKL